MGHHDVDGWMVGYWIYGCRRRGIEAVDMAWVCECPVLIYRLPRGGVNLVPRIS